LYASGVIQLVLDQIYDENKVRPHQYEFARLNLNYTVMSKRKLLQLVQENIVMDGIISI
jgi:glutaminyl-tRNA synthetase